MPSKGETLTRYLTRPDGLICVLTAVATAVTVGIALDVTSAAAQSTNTATRVSTPPSRRIEPQRRASIPAPADEDDAPAAQPNVQHPPSDGADPTSGEPSDGLDGDDPARPQARRNMDGEPLIGQERTQAEDGTPATGEPEPLVRDGEADLTRDPRTRADIDAFEKPSAGYDAVAFQVELDPVLDRRPQRLARFEPYDPIGIRRSSWIIFPEIEFGAGSTSNIRRSPNARSLGFIDARPTVRAVTNWRVHAIELKASGLASVYPGFASENDKAFALEARGRYDFSKRTNLEALVATQRDQESRQARGAVDAARDRTNYVTTRAALALNHRFNRLTVQLRGGISDYDYQPVVALNGTTIDNAQRNYVQRDTAARASWEFKPTLVAFTDISINNRTYVGCTADCIKRDSSGYRAVAGLSFGNAGRIWRGEIGVGFGEQRPDDARLSATNGLILDANFAWRASELTSLLFTARTDFNDSTTVGQSGSVVRTAGLELRHAFRRHLIGTASLKQTLTDYKGVVLSERDTTAEVGAEYFLNPTTTLYSRYSHVWFDSSVATADYHVDTIRFGVRFRQ